MTEPIDEAFLELQREYLSELPDRLAEIRADIGAFRAGSDEAAGSLKMRFHRLAGSGGSYGFPEISQIAREQEQWIATGPPSPDSGRLGEALEQLAGARRRGGCGLPGRADDRGPPRYARTLARSGPPPRVALLVESDPDRAAAVSGQLEEANIRVVRCHLAQSVREIVEREVPDLLLVAV